MKSPRSNYRKNRAIICAAALALAPINVGATTKNWIGGTGNWNNGPSWNPAGQPGDGDLVTIKQNNAAVTYLNSAFPSAVLNSLTLDATNTATLSQAQDVLSAKGEFFGNAFSGAMIQSGGTNNVTGNGLFIAEELGSHGSYTLSGTGQLNVSASENIAHHGTGTFTQNGGSNTLSGDNAYLNIGGDHTASAAYTLTAGTLKAKGIVLSSNGAAAAFNQSGGTSTISDYLELGDDLNPAGPVQYALSNSAVLSASREIIGGIGPATFNQTGGSNTATTDFRLGNNLGASGTFDLSGGTLDASENFYIGAGGDGHFNASAGKIKLGQTLTIGAFAGSTGSFSMSNTASVNSVGVDLAANSQGSFNMTGGTFTSTGTFSIASGNGTGTVNFSGGTLSAINLFLKSGATGKGTFNQSGGSTSFTGTFTLGAHGTYNLSGGSMTVNEMDIDSGGAMKISGGHFKVATLVYFNTTSGAIDVTNQSFVVDYAQSSPLNSVKAAVVAGYANGAWNGPGIESSTAAGDVSKSTAVGFGEASKVLGLSGSNTAQWLGQTVNSTSILVRYTKYGDATLDGSVGFADLVKVAQNYGQILTATWADGDFNFDNNVGFADLVKVAQNYGSALPSAPIPGKSAEFNADLAAAFASIPEPAAPGTLMVAMGFVLCRRRWRAKLRPA